MRDKQVARHTNEIARNPQVWWKFRGLRANKRERLRAAALTVNELTVHQFQTACATLGAVE
jgi:hypothetical protein